MNISVVVPTLGRESLQMTMAALKGQSKKAHEIIIIHDEQRKGVSWARNRGFEKATGDVIAFTDDDCQPPKEWLRSIQNIIERYGAEVVGGTYREKDPLLATIRRIRKKTPKNITEDKHENVGIGGNIAYTRETLEKVKKKYGHIYDEEMITGEDYELIWRIKTIGAKIYFNPVKVIHHRRITRKKYILLQYYRGIGIASLHRMKKKYPNITVHKSILWQDKGLLHKAYLILAKKIIGPCNAKEFRSKGDYLAYWAGAKAEALGFIYGSINKKAGRKTYAKDEVRRR